LKFYKTKSIVLSVVTGMFLLGCGGGGDDAPVAGASSSTAFLSDSRLEGVTYTCGSETGLTTAEGAFTYTSGACSAVEFSIGGVSLGSIDVADINPDGIIYPADLLGLDRNNTSDTELVNLLQVLQSLDSDGNPNNGILIDSNTTTLLENETDLNSSVGTAGRALVDADDAVAHYEDTLRNDLNISVDTVPPSAAIITMTPNETYVDITSITINGEVGAQIWVNGIDSNLSIDINNSATFNVNTSDNTDVNNTSSIVLVDDANKSSDATESSIFRASQATLDLREVAAIKTGLEASTTPRAFTYIQMWNSGADYNISFTPMPTATTETQEYNATVTIMKGLASDTVTVPETVTFSQDLRDTAEVTAMVAEITSNKRAFSYTQQWATGDDYNVTFSDAMRAVSTETQTYDVNATVRKGNVQETVMFTEVIPYSQNLRDLAEVAAIKSSLTDRNFLYTQQWATGSNYALSFSEVPRSATTETQTYPITVTIAKGTVTDTKTFTESVPFSQLLRDMAEVAYIKNNLTSRAFSYTQQWATGADYMLNFSELLKDATTETQTYPVTVTITKGTVSDSVAYSEVVPFSQDLRDSVEVSAIKTNLEAMADMRAAFSYTLQWATGSNYTITFSEAKRIPTAIDQSYSVTITITKGTQTETITYTELVPTTNVNIVLGDGTTTLINDEYADAFVVTNGGIFQKIGAESSFIGAAVSVGTEGLSLTSSGDLLNYITGHSGLSGLSSISLNNSSDGSLVARYEIGTQETNLYELLESLLASVNYVIEDIDFTLYNDVNNTIIDFYVEYNPVDASYVIISLSDKTINVDSDITKVINKDSIVEVGETIVNEQESFTITNILNKGDFLFVMDDSGSMSEEQAASVEAIGRTFATAVARYDLDWKATVIGTSYNNTYSTLTADPSENNITKLTTQLSLGTSGSGTETGLKRAYIALNGGAVVERNNSSLSVIYISDETEHSSLSNFGESDTDFSNSYFAVNGIKYNVIIPTSYTADNDYATRMYLETEGSRANLTNYASGYDQMMDNIVKYAVAKSSSVKLSYPALASSITVHINGVKTTFWEYDPAESAIVFDATNMPNINDQIIVTYSHLDFSAMVSSAKSTFDALADDAKRAYTNNSLSVVFDPASPATPLADTDQTYGVTVTFSMQGYTETSTFQETITNYLDTAKSTFDALVNNEKRLFVDGNVTVTFNPATQNTALVDENQTYDVTVTFEADGATRTSTYEETIYSISSTLEVTSNTDWVQDGVSFESQNHDDSSSSTLNLTIKRDATIHYDISSETCCDKLRITVNSTLIGDFTGAGSVNVLANDAVLLEYHKDGSVSNGTDNAIITIQ